MTTALSFRTLHLHTQGPAVRRLQANINQRFRALGIDNIISFSLKVDGWFGKKTAASVKYLQCAAGLPVTGKVTEQTEAFIHQGIRGIETLSLGSTGTSVCALKQVLTSCGHAHLPLDGCFETQTELAVKAYQRQQGLVEDGVVGEMTWERVVRSRLHSLPCIALFPGVAIASRSVYNDN